jgi:hypothetical protein
MPMRNTPIGGLPTVPPPALIEADLRRELNAAGKTLDSVDLKVMEQRTRLVQEFLRDITFDPATHFLLSVPGDRADLFVEVLVCLPNSERDRLTGGTLDLQAARALASLYPSLGIVLPRT